ncbi:MAG: outer membrane beta-barrel domain-containing protein [Bdellovibrionales bacterium]
MISPRLVHAQDLEGEPDDSASEQEIEALYDKDEAPVERSRPSRPDREVKEATTLSDLSTLAPFTDVAVIQRRFLPKTQRFEISGTAFSNLNNPFFNSVGLSARIAYYLREQYALEGIFAFATTSSRQVTDDLEQKRRITTDNVVTSKGFMALAFKWNPIYGKITWLNHSIVPFDLNFNAGLGLTQTNADESEPTLHLGTSQVFAWSKSMAFRWDLIWNIYQATTTDSTGKKDTLQQNDLFLGVGVSFYFPEATYR